MLVMEPLNVLPVVVVEACAVPVLISPVEKGDTWLFQCNFNL